MVRLLRVCESASFIEILWHFMFFFSTIRTRHFTEGRMKCQAFIEYPNVSLATQALDKVHGVVLKGKPLVVVCAWG